MSELSSALVSAVVCCRGLGGFVELMLFGWFVVLRREKEEVSRGFAKGEMGCGAYGVHMDGGFGFARSSTASRLDGTPKICLSREPSG